VPELRPRGESRPLDDPFKVRPKIASGVAVLVGYDPLAPFLCFVEYLKQGRFKLGEQGDGLAGGRDSGGHGPIRITDLRGSGLYRRRPQGRRPATWHPVEVVKLPQAKKGFVLLPRRWVVARSIAWATRFLRQAKDYERLQRTLAAVHCMVFGGLMRTRLVV
jgi:hypothetical protein